MAELYLGQFESFTNSEGELAWKAPAAALGVLDLRSIPQCGDPGPVPQGFALFSYATAQVGNPLLTLHLGSDLRADLTPVQKSGIVTLLGLPPATVLDDKLGRAIRQLLIDPTLYDPTGDIRYKPLQVHPRTRSVEADIGGFANVFSDRISQASIDAHIAIFQNDYVRQRDVVGLDPAVLRRWVGAQSLLLFERVDREAADALLPVQYRTDGFERPQSSFTETWTRADANFAGDITGVDHTWSGAVGTARVEGNKVQCGGVNQVVHRYCTTALSTADHRHEADGQMTIGDTITRSVAISSRKAASATETGYFMHLIRDTDGHVRKLTKRVTGTETVIQADTTDPGGSVIAMGVEAIGSAIAGNSDATTFSGTDSTITGNLNVGFRTFIGTGAANANEAKLDANFSEDVVAAGGTGHQNLLLMGVG